MRSSFSNRNSCVAEKKIQFGTLDAECKNRLWNSFSDACDYLDCDECMNHFEEINYVLDWLGKEHISTPIQCRTAMDNIHKEWNVAWYRAFDILEAFLSYFNENQMGSYSDEYCNSFNHILEEEKSAYRFLNCKAVPITSQLELNLLAETMDSPHESVNQHLQKALERYADRENPDYENSIKDSISAVEAMCCIITGLTGKEATLGKAIKRLEDKGVVIHSSMKAAFNQLYSYTSNENGIRHGGIDFKRAPAEDAKYMLLSCSAFSNYLLE